MTAATILKNITTKITTTTTISTTTNHNNNNNSNNHKSQQQQKITKTTKVTTTIFLKWANAQTTKFTIWSDFATHNVAHALTIQSTHTTTDTNTCADRRITH